MVRKTSVVYRTSVTYKNITRGFTKEKTEGQCLYPFPKWAFNMKGYDLWLEKKKNGGDKDNGSGCDYSS